MDAIDSIHGMQLELELELAGLTGGAGTGEIDMDPQSRIQERRESG